MGNLPEIRKNNAVAIFQGGGAIKAIDVRRDMVTMPEVAKSLSPVEKLVFAASTKTQICEISDDELVAKTAQMFKYIAMDVGFNIPNDQNEWTYICTRLMNVLQRHYSQLTLADIKLAFELAMVGDLDEYLPKDRNGNGDKNHYQQFNVDYFAKIINAYRRKQNEVTHKAFKALPQPSYEMTPEQKLYYSNLTLYELIQAFLKYKYTGNAGIKNSVQEWLFYERLVENGLADDYQITIEDKQIAFQQTLVRIAKGMVNQYEAIHIRREGIEHETVKSSAIHVAQKHALYKAFDQMIKDEIYIYDYIKYKKKEG